MAEHSGEIMGKYILLLIFIDLLGKFVYESSHFRFMIAILIVILADLKLLKYLKGKFDSFIFSIISFTFNWLNLGLSFFFFYHVIMIWYTLSKVDIDIFALVFYFYLTALYIVICLFVINSLSKLDKVIEFAKQKIKNTTVIVSLLVILILLVTELFSTYSFYSYAFQDYQNYTVIEKISEVKKQPNVTALDEITIYLRNAYNLHSISNYDYSERIKELKQMYDNNKFELPSDLKNETTADTSKVVPPNYQIFIKLFRFSFYQHYILGLNDDLANFQKYIASNLYFSCLQMVHVLFSKLVDLIIIGKLISILSEKKNRRKAVIIAKRKQEELITEGRSLND